MKRIILLAGMFSILTLSCVVTDKAKFLVMGASPTPTATPTATYTPTVTPSPTATYTPTPTISVARQKAQLFSKISEALAGGKIPAGITLNGPNKKSNEHYFFTFPDEPEPFVMVEYLFMDDLTANTYTGIIEVWYYKGSGEADDMWDAITGVDYMQGGEFDSNYGQGIDTCITLLYSNQDPSSELAQKAFRPTETMVVYLAYWGSPRAAVTQNLETYEASIIDNLIAAVK